MDSQINKNGLATNFNIYQELSNGGKDRDALCMALNFLETFKGRGLDGDAVNFVRGFKDSERPEAPMEKELFESLQHRVVMCVGGSISSLKDGSVIGCEIPTAPFFNRSYAQYLRDEFEVGEISTSENYDSQPSRVTRCRFDEEKRNVINIIAPEDLAFEIGDVFAGVDEYSLPPVHGIRKDATPSLTLFARPKSATDEFGAELTTRGSHGLRGDVGFSLGDAARGLSATAITGKGKSSDGRV